MIISIVDKAARAACAISTQGNGQGSIGFRILSALIMPSRRKHAEIIFADNVDQQIFFETISPVDAQIAAAQMQALYPGAFHAPDLTGLRNRVTL
ncbi:hypothetical protein [Sphingobium sp.]|uniref:hypothetical protein n=1 Tax=Sphingobium sp. TaxID=1912891 RepID=UPI002B6522BA|nr:hypothetical protein [Sphingobium sp.]HUD95825.1 hypothetical protein [Sphingobium sp.]